MEIISTFLSIYQLNFNILVNIPEYLVFPSLNIHQMISYFENYSL